VDRFLGSWSKPEHDYKRTSTIENKKKKHRLLNDDRAVRDRSKNTGGKGRVYHLSIKKGEDEQRTGEGE